LIGELKTIHTPKSTWVFTSYVEDRDTVCNGTEGARSMDIMTVRAGEKVIFGGWIAGNIGGDISLRRGQCICLGTMEMVTGSG